MRTRLYFVSYLRPGAHQWSAHMLVMAADHAHACQLVVDRVGLTRGVVEVWLDDTSPVHEFTIVPRGNPRR